jgi:hypothetical protein
MGQVHVMKGSRAPDKNVITHGASSDSNIGIYRK